MEAWDDAKVAELKKAVVKLHAELADQGPHADPAAAAAEASADRAGNSVATMLMTEALARETAADAKLASLKCDVRALQASLANVVRRVNQLSAATGGTYQRRLALVHAIHKAKLQMEAEERPRLHQVHEEYVTRLERELMTMF